MDIKELKDAIASMPFDDRKEIFSLLCAPSPDGEAMRTKHPVLVGEHTIKVGLSGDGTTTSVINMTTQAPTSLGDIGMNATTGSPQVFAAQTSSAVDILPAYQFIERINVLANSQSQSFTGLDGDTDSGYVLTFTFINNSGVNATTYHLEFNNAGTPASTNPTVVSISVVNTLTIANTGTQFEIASCGNTANANFATGIIYLPSVFSTQAQIGMQGLVNTIRDGVQTQLQYTGYAQSVGNITSIQVTGNDANNIGQGSNLMLYRMRFT